MSISAAGMSPARGGAPRKALAVDFARESGVGVL